MYSVLCQLTCRAIQHARPYRALVHDVAALQRNVSCMPLLAVFTVMSHQVVALEEPRNGSKDWSVVQVCAVRYFLPCVLSVTHTDGQPGRTTAKVHKYHPHDIYVHISSLLTLHQTVAKHHVVIMPIEALHAMLFFCT